MLAHKIPLIRRVDHHGVFRESVCVQIVQQSPDVVINGPAAAEEIFDEFLVDPAATLPLRYPLRQFKLPARIGKPGTGPLLVEVTLAQDFQGLPVKRPSRGFRTKLIERGWFRHLDIGVKLRIPFRVIKRLMSSLEMTHQHEGLVRISLVQPLHT